jgi:capsular polysaccharide biosynthesis protein
MKSPAPNGNCRAVRFYAHLIRLYPRPFRDKFGTEMEQLFRDQHKATLQYENFPMLFAFWVRTLMDLAASLSREHIEQLSHPMSTRSFLNSCRKSLSFTRLFIAITICLATACTVVTVFILPKTYLGTVRVNLLSPTGPSDLHNLQTTFEKIRSSRVLDPVIEELNLTKVLAEQAGLSAPLHPVETREVMKKMLALSQLKNTSLLEIRVFSEDPAVSAQIANKIAEVARRLEKIEVIESASPVARPIRPNVPKNIIIGTLASMLAASLLAVATRLGLRASGTIPPSMGRS